MESSSQKSRWMAPKERYLRSSSDFLRRKNPYTDTHTQTTPIDTYTNTHTHIQAHRDIHAKVEGVFPGRAETKEMA